MKTTLIALTALATLTFTPRPASALGDKEAAILGGVLGGVIIGAAINDALDHDNRYEHREVRVDYGHDQRVDRGRNDDFRRDDRRDDRCEPSGYWTYRSVKVWVPKSVYYSYDHCGNRIRHYEPGRWEYRREKVWVPARGRW